MTDDEKRMLGHAKGRSHTDFPILDSPRTMSNAELGRAVIDFLGYLEPYIEERDDWCAMPLRLVHDRAADWHLECGPYSLDRGDIELLRAAIAEYYRAPGARPLRVVK